MRYIIALAAIVIAYVAVGIVTYSGTAERVVAACGTPPGATAHLLLWPASLASSYGMPNQC